MALVKLAKEERSGGYTVLGVPESANIEEAALHVAKDGSVWLLDQELAKRIIDNGRTCYRYSFMGKTDFVIIYPQDSVSIFDGIKYVTGEFMIMQDKGYLSCMTWDEMMKAVAEYNSRTVLLRIAGKSMAAYEIG